MQWQKRAPRPAGRNRKKQEEETMQHECRITVLETKVFEDYQEQYLASPKSGPCLCFRKGDTFLLKHPGAG